jgi:hypothetical protein
MVRLEKLSSEEVQLVAAWLKAHAWKTRADEIAKGLGLTGGSPFRKLSKKSPNPVPMHPRVMDRRVELSLAKIEAWLPTVSSRYYPLIAAWFEADIWKQRAERLAKKLGMTGGSPFDKKPVARRVKMRGPG